MSDNNFDKENNEFCDCVHDNIVRSAKESMLDDELVYDIADFFKVFGDSSRIKLLYSLLAREMCVGDLAELLGMTQSAVSHQMRMLRQNSIVKYRRRGKAVFYSLDDDHVSALLALSLEHINHKKGYK